MHRSVPSANPSLRGRTSKVSTPLDNDGALNDLSSSRTERPSACTSIPEQYPPPTRVAERHAHAASLRELPGPPPNSEPAPSRPRSVAVAASTMLAARPLVERPPSAIG